MQTTGLLKIFDAAVAGGATTCGTAHFVEGYENLFLQFSAVGASVGGIIKFQGSWSDTCPNFAAAQSVTNNWDFVDVIDLEDGASIDGDTGITEAAADYLNLEVNAGGLKWICARITTYNAGTFYLNVFAKAK